MLEALYKNLLADFDKEKVAISVIEIFFDLLSDFPAKELKYFEDSLQLAAKLDSKKLKTLLFEVFKKLYVKIGYNSILLARKVGLQDISSLMNECH